MDEIIRAVSKDGFAKISVVTARDAVQRANAIHHCSPTAIAALGRSLCAASMLGDLLKEENGAVTLRIGEEERRFEKDTVALVRLRCDF